MVSPCPERCLIPIGSQEVSHGRALPAATPQLCALSPLRTALQCPQAPAMHALLRPRCPHTHPGGLVLLSRGGWEPPPSKH